MLRKLICKLKHGHSYKQFNKLVYRDGLPIMRYGKQCKKCGKVRWMR